MDEQRKEEAVTFAVDLSKEEYLKFYKTITRYSSAAPMQRIGIFFVIVMVAFPLFSMYKNGGFQNFFSLDTLSLFIPAVLLLLYNVCLMPYFRKRQAERGYDAAIAGGQIFAGTVTINSGRITKTTPSGSLTMSFSDRVLFHEQEDMQIFVNTQGRGIVLPARCMTAETAKAVRDIAFAALPPSFCKVKAPIVCERETPMVLCEEEEPAEILFRTVVTYNKDDREYISKEIFYRRLKNGVLPNCIISFLIALLFGIGQDRLTVLLIFSAVLLFLLLTLAIGGKRRAKVMLSEQNFRFDFKITEKAVTVDGGQRLGLYTVPWMEVRHVFESEKYVELYSKYHYICIPKRLIEDIDSFGKLVDNCRKERNQ